VEEAPLRKTGAGLVPEGDGWFIVNARETRWREDDLGARTPGVEQETPDPSAAYARFSDSVDTPYRVGWLP
jgi:hypothetical protein